MKVSHARHRRGILVAVAVTVGLALAALTAPVAAAAEPPDLAALVLSQIAGYEPASPGVGLSGALTTAQLEEFVETKEARSMDVAGMKGYARTFTSTDGPLVLIMAFDCGSLAKARRFEAGVRAGAKEGGPVVPIPGLDGFRGISPPDREDGSSVQQSFFRVGQLGFLITLADGTDNPVTEAEILRVTMAQAAAVPPEVARSPTPSAVQDGDGLGDHFGRIIALTVAISLQIAVVTLLAMALAWRRRPAPASTWSPPVAGHYAPLRRPGAW